MSLARNPKQYTGVRPINPPNVVYAERAPTSTDTAYVKGDLWEDLTGLASWQYAGAGVWIALGTGATGGVVTLTGGSGGAISPSAGNISLLGTANQITSTGSGGGHSITFSIPAAFTAPGSIASTTTVTAGTGLIATTGGVTATAGDILASDGDIITTRSDAGADVTIEATNSDNTNGASRAGVEIATGGASSGDPFLSFQISGVGASTMTIGLDNSASDIFVISNSTAIGTSNALTLSQAGALTATTSITATLGNITATNGNLVLTAAGNKMIRSSVGSTSAAGANSIGSVTLVGGTVTVSTTAVTTNSLIQIWRQSVGATGAAALGNLSVGTIVNGTSFVINAWQAADATALQASDVSVIGWDIVN
jgi:hypothetical protein